MRDDTNYLEAFKEVSAQAKASVAIASVPLGLVLVQLRYLSGVESVWLKSIATLAVVSLFLATVFAWLIAVMVQSTYAMELYKRDGEEPEKGRAYMRWVLDLANDPQAYSEAWILCVCKKLVLPFWSLAALGYLSLMLLVLSQIWASS